MKSFVSILPAGLLICSVLPAIAGTTELISVRNPNVPQVAASRGGQSAAISADGRFVAFLSLSDDLIPNDARAYDGTLDIYVEDRTTGTIEKINGRSAADEGRSVYDGPSITPDGRFVAFIALAVETNRSDVFVHDRTTHVTSRVTSNTSQRVGGGIAMSANARFVAYSQLRTDASGQTFTDLVVQDRQSGTIAPASVSSGGVLGNGSSSEPALSADGRYVLFLSDSTNLVANTPAGFNFYVHDMQTGSTRHVGPGADFVANTASISADGRFVAFASGAANLVSGDTNGWTDVFVRDLQTGTATRASVSSNGTQANFNSLHPSISADGRMVAFASAASNLVTGDTNGNPPQSTAPFDIFVHDRQTQQTTRVNAGANAAEANSTSDYPVISADGLQVAFESFASNLVSGDENRTFDVFVRNRSTSATRLVSHLVVDSQSPFGESYTGAGRAISADGRFVVFGSNASTLVTLDANRREDIFLRNRASRTTTRVSVKTGGSQGLLDSFRPSVSGNGRFVAFDSLASNLVTGDTNGAGDIFMYDRTTGVTSRESVAPNGSQANNTSQQAAISDDGRYVAFNSYATNLVSQPTSNAPEVYVRDRQTGAVVRASVASDGTAANNLSILLAISGNGRYIGFTSRATNLVSGGPSLPRVWRCFIYDRQTGKTTFAGIDANGVPTQCAQMSISADGRFVAFSSVQVFVRDRTLGVTSQVSVDSNGNPPVDGGGSSYPSISRNGRYVAFMSTSANLVAGDTNQREDVFVHDRQLGTTTRGSVASNGTQSSVGVNIGPSISDDGRTVVFSSGGADLVSDDLNELPDVFVHERDPDITVIRVNSGGPAFTDSHGRLWAADKGFNTGQTANHAVAIANTVDDALYQTERFDPPAAPDLSYKFAVPNGTYLVRLHFAETAPVNFGVGKKVFDVSLEGVRRFQNVDIYAEAGARTALIKSATVNVTDGQLNIAFLRKVQNPSVSAIEVIQQ